MEGCLACGPFGPDASAVRTAYCLCYTIFLLQIEEVLSAAPVAAAADSSDISSAQAWFAAPEEATNAVADSVSAVAKSDTMLEAAAGAPTDVLGPLGGAAVGALAVGAALYPKASELWMTSRLKRSDVPG